MIEIKFTNLWRFYTMSIHCKQDGLFSLLILLILLDLFQFVNQFYLLYSAGKCSYSWLDWNELWCRVNILVNDNVTRIQNMLNGSDISYCMLLHLSLFANVGCFSFLRLFWWWLWICRPLMVRFIILLVFSQ